jgi:hypothetical protein
MTARQQNLIPVGGDRATTLGEIAAMRARLDALERQLAGTTVLPGAALFPRVWVDRLAELVAMEWGIGIDDLRGACRRHIHTRPRFVWVWLVRAVAKLSFSETARLTFYGDHTAVLHACRRVDGWRESNADLRAVTDQLLRIGQALRAPAATAEEGDQ